MTSKSADLQATSILICSDPAVVASAVTRRLTSPADMAGDTPAAASPLTGPGSSDWAALTGHPNVRAATFDLSEATISQCIAPSQTPAFAVIVATPDDGLTEELRRQSVILQQIGVSQALLAISVSQIDSLTEPQFNELCFEFEAFATALGLQIAGATPISSHTGSNVLSDAERPAWYTGATLLDEIVKCLRAGQGGAIQTQRPARLAIVQPTSPQDSGGTQVTRIEGSQISGTLQTGQSVVALPSGDRGTLSQITSASSGNLSVLVDGELRADPGDILATSDARPELADQIAAHVVWIDEHPLLPGRPFEVVIGGQRVTASVSRLRHKVNPDNLDEVAVHTLTAGDVGFCNVSFERAIAFDAYEANPAFGRLTIHDKETGALLGFGQIEFALRRATNIHWQALAVDRNARAELKGQQPCCLWFTGLSGSGKSTVASLLEKRLHALGRHTYTLDGDNVRHGLNRDLGFTDADRVENIRRVSETAKLFVDSGLIVMVSFISPFRAERQMARALFDNDEFLEIFVDTPLEVCEQRDPKGLYKKARSGELKNFTGIDSAYERPEAAEIHLDAAANAPEALVERLLAVLTERGLI